MFELLNPLYFYIGGAIGVLAPLVLHLIQKSRTVRLPFSTIRFLKLAEKKSASRIKMQNILLWLIRTALLVALALAFAMPVLRDRSLGQWLGRAPRDVAVVIDGSYSMGYNLSGTPVWQKAIDAAVTLVENLSEQDRFCIFVARDHVEPLIAQLSQDKTEAFSRLNALKVSETTSQLVPALVAANNALRKGGTRREREIHIITDGQLLPWEGFGEEAKRLVNAGAASPGAWDPSKVDKETVCFVTLLGAIAPENAAPIDVILDPPVITWGLPARVVVRLGYTGPPKAATAALHVDGTEIAVRSVSLGMDEDSDVVFTLPPLEEGPHVSSVKIMQDNLALDDSFHFIARASRRLRVLCVGSADDTFFLRAALKAGANGNSAIDTDWVGAAELAEEILESYTCVFLCNSLPLGGSEVSAVEEYVSSGGLLTMFPGDQATAQDYGAWTCLPASQAAPEVISTADRKRTLHWEIEGHTLLAPLAAADSTFNVAVKTQLVWESLEAGAERIVTQGEQNPFLTGRKFGSGYVLVFAVSADRSWSDFPLSPCYLPLVHQIVAFGTGIGKASHYAWCSTSLPLERYVDEVTADSILLGPEGDNIPVRIATVEGRQVLRAEGLTRSGIYSLRATGRAEPVPAIAVNAPREESNLNPIDTAKIESALGLKNVNLARNTEDLLVRLQNSRQGRTFGEYFLWFVLALASVEFFYANHLLKEEPAKDHEDARR